MTWTREKPTTPGLYWYRHDPDSQGERCEVLKIVRDDQHDTWSARSPESGTADVAAYDGEWYGPLSPPAHLMKDWDPTDTKDNARIIVRLRHGGLFYLKTKIPEETARILSSRLKSLREHGGSVPANLRMKISEVVRELITFTHSPPKEEQ